MLFFKKKKVKVDDELIELQMDICEVLLEEGFTWEEINKAIGFRKTWYGFNRLKMIERNMSKPE